MAEGRVNTILKQVYELNTANSSRAMDIQSTISTLQHHQIQQVIDRVLADFSSKTHLYQFDQVTLDLGQLRFESFDRELPLRIESQLREFLARNIVQGEIISDGKAIPLGTHLVDLFRHFLYYGYIPWQAGANESPSSILQQMLEEYTIELVAVLRELGRYNQVIKRLVYQFNDTELERVVTAITPESAQYIIAYKANFIKAAEQEKSKQEEANRSNLRNKVWEVIFTYLLNKDEVAFNNRQHFLQSLITQVALRNNESYISLLQAIYRAVGNDPYTYDREGFADLISALFKQQFPRKTKQNKVEEVKDKVSVDLDKELRFYLKYGFFNSIQLTGNKFILDSELIYYFSARLIGGRISERDKKLWVRLYRETELLNQLPRPILNRVLKQIRTRPQLAIVQLLEAFQSLGNQQKGLFQQLSNQFATVGFLLVDAKSTKWKGTTKAQVQWFVEQVLKHSQVNEAQFSMLLQELKKEKSIRKSTELKRVLNYLEFKSVVFEQIDSKEIKRFITSWKKVFDIKGRESAKQTFIEQLTKWEEKHSIKLETIVEQLKRHVTEMWLEQQFEQFVLAIELDAEANILFSESEEAVEAHYSGVTGTTQSSELDNLILSFIHKHKAFLESQLYDANSERNLIRRLQLIYEQYLIPSITLWKWISKDRFGIFSPQFQVKWTVLKKKRAFKNLVEQQKEISIESKPVVLQEFNNKQLKNREIQSIIKSEKLRIEAAALSPNFEAELASVFNRIIQGYSVRLEELFVWLSKEFDKVFSVEVKGRLNAFRKSSKFKQLADLQVKQELANESIQPTLEKSSAQTNQLIRSFIYDIKRDLISKTSSSQSTSELIQLLIQISERYSISVEVFWSWVVEDKLQLFDDTFLARWKVLGKSKTYQKLIEKQRSKEFDNQTLKAWRHIFYVLLYGKLPWWNSAYTWTQFEKDVSFSLSNKFTNYYSDLKQVTESSWLVIGQRLSEKRSSFYQLIYLYLKANKHTKRIELVKAIESLDRSIYERLALFGVLPQKEVQLMRWQFAQQVINRRTNESTFLKHIITSLFKYIKVEEIKSDALQQLETIFKSSSYSGILEWLSNQEFAERSVGDSILRQMILSSAYESDPIHAFITAQRSIHSFRQAASPLEMLLSVYRENPKSTAQYFTQSHLIKQVLKEEHTEHVFQLMSPLFGGVQAVLFKETNSILLEMNKHLSKQESDEIWLLWHEALLYHIGISNLHALSVNAWRNLLHQVIRKVKGTVGLVQLMQRIKESKNAITENQLQLGIGWQLVEPEQEVNIEEENGANQEYPLNDEAEKPYRKLGEVEERLLLDPIYVQHCGLVIIAPYLSRLFEMCQIPVDQLKTDQDLKEKAVQLLMYAATGEDTFQENEAVMAKVLCGIPIASPVDGKEVLPADHKSAVDGMLYAVTQHWPGLQGTSVEGLRESFLQRDGKLEEDDEVFLLHVEERAFDMLLDRIPWSIAIVNLSWMDKRIEVTWRA